MKECHFEGPQVSGFYGLISCNPIRSFDCSPDTLDSRGQMLPFFAFVGPTLPIAGPIRAIAWQARCMQLARSQFWLDARLKRSTHKLPGAERVCRHSSSTRLNTRLSGWPTIACARMRHEKSRPTEAALSLPE